jgi:hypothetical protein
VNDVEENLHYFSNLEVKFILKESIKTYILEVLIVCAFYEAYPKKILRYYIKMGTKYLVEK